jgi:hypothetical protein
MIRNHMTRVSISLTGDPAAVFQAAFDLMNATTLAARSKEIAPGASLTLLPMPENRSGMAFDAAPGAELILDISGSIVIGLVSNYLYDKLKGRTRLRLRINRRVINIDQGEITQIIEESLEEE